VRLLGFKPTGFCKAFGEDGSWNWGTGEGRVRERLWFGWCQVTADSWIGGEECSGGIVKV
jgi:hypothetical protein